MCRNLHERILKFNTDYRPATRYLYFNFAINILRRKRYAEAGWWKSCIEYVRLPLFFAPRGWTNKTTIRKLAIRVGHLPDHEAELFAALIRGNLGGPVHEKTVEDSKAQEKEEVVVSWIQHGYRDVPES
ncbi:hypothetical protein GGR51DRAFT_537878 [Nemania sp. FL0031]|nr:hypothetical protein GGR51DRAFT_537878 [Nemania sp. FL0031]